MKKFALVVLVLSAVCLTSCQKTRESSNEEKRNQALSASRSSATASQTLSAEKFNEYILDRCQTYATVFVREPQNEGEREKTGRSRIDSKIGDEIEVLIYYVNYSKTPVKDVLVKADIPNEALEYIPQSTVLDRGFGAAQESKAIEDGILEDGVNIGGYERAKGAQVRFRCKVKGTGQKEYNGNIPIKITVFDGIDMYAGWARICVTNAENKIVYGGKSKDDLLWGEMMDASKGELVEFKIYYKNNSSEMAKDVTLSVDLPDFLEYIPGNTAIYSSQYTNGAIYGEEAEKYLISDGLDIGDYESGEEANVVYTVKIKEELPKEVTELTSTAKVSVNEIVNTDEVKIYIQK